MYNYSHICRWATAYDAPPHPPPSPLWSKTHQRLQNRNIIRFLPNYSVIHLKTYEDTLQRARELSMQRERERVCPTFKIIRFSSRGLFFGCFLFCWLTGAKSRQIEKTFSHKTKSALRRNLHAYSKRNPGKKWRPRKTGRGGAFLVLFLLCWQQLQLCLAGVSGRCS